MDSSEPDRGGRGLDPGLAGGALACEPTHVGLDGVGHLGVADGRVAAFGVLASDLKQPAVGIVAVAEFGVAGIGHLRGPEPAAGHELDGDLALPVTAGGGLFEPADLVGVEPAFRDAAGVVDANHARMYRPIRLEATGMTGDSTPIAG
jgi:hypothetical protein